VDKIKVLYVITALNVGGAEMMLYRMLSRLNRELFDVSVITLINKGPVGKMIEDDLRIPVQALNIKSSPGVLTGIIRLKNMIKGRAPRVVHTHMVHANLLTRIVRLFYRVPVLICTIHNIEEKGRRKSARWRILAYRLTDPLCDFTSQVSRAGMEKYIAIKAVPRRKIACIPNGIDLNLFAVEVDKVQQLRKELGLDNQFVYLAVGSLTRQKDYPNMLKAFAAVQNEAPNSVLLIVGTGPLENELRKAADDLHLKDSVLFLGLRSDIAVLMKAADAYVMSSAWEGLPVVLLEAAASKLPIIATDVGGNREIVLDKNNGFLVPPEDAQALARAMLEVLTVPEEKQIQMGINGYNHVKENYAVEKITGKWESIYLELLSKKRDNKGELMSRVRLE